MVSCMLSRSKTPDLASSARTRQRHDGQPTRNRHPALPTFISTDHRDGQIWGLRTAGVAVTHPIKHFCLSNPPSGKDLILRAGKYTSGAHVGKPPKVHTIRATD